MWSQERIRMSVKQRQRRCRSSSRPNCAHCVPRLCTHAPSRVGPGPHALRRPGPGSSATGASSRRRATAAGGAVWRAERTDHQSLVRSTWSDLLHVGGSTRNRFLPFIWPIARARYRTTLAQTEPIGQTNRARSGTEAGAQVVEHVRREIEAGRLHPGDRLPPERELALKMEVSRPSLRSGLRTLQALGIITSRRGAGTFIVKGPPLLGKAPFEFLAALHGFTLDQMYETRRLLEVGAAALAAERASGEQMTGMADEVTGMFAALDDPQAFLCHDLGFHRAGAAGSGNPILAAIVGTLTEIIWETGRMNMEGFSLRQSAETHRRIYEAIRSHHPERAQREMAEHLEHARWEQVEKEAGDGAKSSEGP